MNKQLLSLALVFIAIADASAFCGFYVAKADAKLFNKTSEVIMVRNGEHSTITMSSDFQGEVKDFAMVVPVPVVLKKEQVRVIESDLIRKLDDYSGPRLVSYNDADPCYVPPQPTYSYGDMTTMACLTATGSTLYSYNSVAQTVKIEARYAVGEYDILILSATESSGLETWLIANGYKIPEGAKEVLEPYVKSNMKFFVVKANTDELKRMNTTKLRPIQIDFDSKKFMLPIRLGMANAKEAQDMIVYCFSKVGRTEVTNYRTVEMPTGQDVPLFVKDEFGTFYKDLYYKTYAKEGKNAVQLEYAWDISSTVTMFCDPCVGDPPMLQDLMNAGVNWVEQYHGGYQGTIYFTRLHVTYDRAHFPQDLQFIETPNQENYQARYVLHYPAVSNFECEKANAYLVDLQKRRLKELDNYAVLTGQDATLHSGYASEYNRYIRKNTGTTGKKTGSLLLTGVTDGKEILITFLSVLSITLMLFALSRKNKPKNSA
jgi:hypothetical protein